MPPSASATFARCWSPRRQRRQHGRGQSALRRQRLGAPARATSALGTKTEIKNLNSFRFVAARHRVRDRAAHRVLEAADGRRRRPGCGTRRRRDRLDAEQGRGARLSLFPGAGPAAACLDAAWIAAVTPALPELPDARRRRFVEQYHLPEYDAGVLTQSMPLADYFEARRRAAAERQSRQQLGDGGADAQAERDPRGHRRRRRSPPAALGGADRADRRRRHHRTDGQGAYSRRCTRPADEPAEIVAAEGLGRDRRRQSAIDRAGRRGARTPSAARSPTIAPARRSAFGFLVGQVDEGARRQARIRPRERAAAPARSKRTRSMIEAQHLSKVYSRGVYALRELSLRIDKGEFIFLTGPSGAGKSTLLRLLLRQEVPTRGPDRRRRARSRDADARAGADIPPLARLRLPGLPADAEQDRA